MERYSVQITRTALADMEEIYFYIAEKLQSPANAIGQYNRIADEILTLDQFPERYPIPNGEFFQNNKLRRLLVDHYSVFYKVVEDTVIVTDVLYSSSDLEERLGGRQK